MLAVEPVGLDSAQEELRSVGVGTSVGHGKNAGAGVLELKVLILKLHAIDGLAASAVAAGKVTALAHEVVDDAVEFGSLEVEGLSAPSRALLSCAKRPEVFRRLWNNISAEGHLNAAARAPPIVMSKNTTGLGILICLFALMYVFTRACFENVVVDRHVNSILSEVTRTRKETCGALRRIRSTLPKRTCC